MNYQCSHQWEVEIQYVNPSDHTNTIPILPDLSDFRKCRQDVQALMISNIVKNVY